MLVKVIAAVAFAALLWSLLRFALGLRGARLSREQARASEEARGRRVVAEIPLEGRLLFFLEDAGGFYWGENEARKSEIAGARMLLNGAVIAAFVRAGSALPGSPSPEEYEGRERWDVALYRRDGSVLEVPCGELREGVSRGIAAAVFEAIKTAGGR